jgi:ribosomal protein L2
MKVGSSIESRVELGTLNVGTNVYDISGKYIRAGGTSGTILGREGLETIVRMPSLECKRLKSTSKCMLGSVHKEKRELRQRAGRRRNEGRRPRVTGKAMNVCDHPLGGNTKGGKELKTI